MDADSHQRGTQARVEDELHESLIIRRMVLAAFLLNLVIAAAKFIIARTSGSIAITASVIDSASDCIASLAVYIGVRISTRRTETFPLGMYKIENLISVVVAIFIFLAGYEIAREVVFPGHPSSPEIGTAALVVLATSAAAIFAFGRYAARLGARTGSPALEAEGKHRQVDVLSTIVVIASSVLTYFDLRIAVFGISADQIAALVILVFIARAGWGLLRDGMRVLLDASIDAESLETVRSIIVADADVREVTQLVGRSAGRYRFIQATVTLSVSDFETAHRISHRIEESVRRQIPHIERLVIHYEPEVKPTLTVAVPVSGDGRTAAAHLAAAASFLLITFRRDGGAEERVKTVAHARSTGERKRGIAIAELLAREGANVVVVGEEMKRGGAKYALAASGIEVEVVLGTDTHEMARIAFNRATGNATGGDITGRGTTGGDVTGSDVTGSDVTGESTTHGTPG